MALDKSLSREGEPSGSPEPPDVRVLIEVEYRTTDEQQAREWSRAHALWIFAHDEVEEVSVDLKVPRDMPITKAYLSDE